MFATDYLLCRPTPEKNGSDTSTIFPKKAFHPCLLGNNHHHYVYKLEMHDSKT